MITDGNSDQGLANASGTKGSAGIRATTGQNNAWRGRRIEALTILAWLAIVISGCVTSRSMQRQVERVAKDWCLVIRASQVIPIYPLTEDLVPGDVFLVEQTREEQVQQYDKMGFLPLDHHLARIRFENYSNFYEGCYSLGDRTWKHDSDWMLPDRSRTFTGTNSPAKMPLAAFPSYSFQITRSAGLKLALPIQGVSTALGLLNASSAMGNVVLSEATTYGIDESSLAPVIYAWGEANRTNLSQFVSSNGPPRYLRVVNRVYLVNSVEVGVTRTSETRAQARADANPIPSGIDLASNSNEGATNRIDLKENGAASKLSSGAARSLGLTLNDLNQSLGSVSGAAGAVKFTSATSRAVAISQTFPRPLTIGYIGYDIPLLPGGLLGAYSSTLNTLTSRTKPVPERDLKPAHFTYVWGYTNAAANTNRQAGENWRDGGR